MIFYKKIWANLNGKEIGYTFKTPSDFNIGKVIYNNSKFFYNSGYIYLFSDMRMFYVRKYIDRVNRITKYFL